MKNISIYVIYLIFWSTTSFARQIPAATPKISKFGKVEITEFETRGSGPDSAAIAVVLFDVGSGYFQISAKGGLAYVFERHTRYKINHKDGYDYGNMELQLYKNGGSENILDGMEAATYNLENGKIVTSKLTRDAKFSEKQDKNYTKKKFALPNVKEGSIVEYKYKITSDFIFTLRPWYFQRSIPTLISYFSVTIPEYYRYKSRMGGYVALNPRQERINGSDGIAYLKLSYLANHIPALKEEGFITTTEDYISKVGFELSSVSVPGEVYKEFTSTWPKIVAGLKEDESFGGFIGKRNYSKTILADIIKAETKPDTVLQMIFNYVKKNIKWNGHHSIYASGNNAKNVLEKRSGNSSDINLCLLTLLKEAGIQASPVLLSTRDNGAHPGFPMLTDFNNVILEAEIGDQKILLDATDIDHCPGLIGYANLNHEGLKVNLQATDAAWIKLEEDQQSRRNITLMLTLDQENKLTGKQIAVSTRYEALKRRSKYHSATSEADFLKEYKTERPGLGLKNYEIKNLDNHSDPLTEIMDIVIEDNVEEAGNLAYFTPLLFEKTSENPFKLEERKFPVDFAYPVEESFRMTLEFPENYQLDKTPKNEKVILPGETAVFTFTFAAEKNKLIVMSKIAVKKALFSPEEYHYLKELFKNIVRKQSEQIVFKKN